MTNTESLNALPANASDRTAKISIDDPRVFLAAERTLLAWVRTSIALMGLGFLVAKFGLFVREMSIMRGEDLQDAPRFSLWIGAAMVVLGILMTIVASYEHFRFLRRLQIDQFVGKTRTIMSLAITMALSLVGIAMVVYLFAV